MNIAEILGLQTANPVDVPGIYSIVREDWQRLNVGMRQLHETRNLPWELLLQTDVFAVPEAQALRRLLLARGAQLDGISADPAEQVAHSSRWPDSVHHVGFCHINGVEYKLVRGTPQPKRYV